MQLPEGTHLTIDETQLEVGTLNSVGVENARLLKYLSEYQKVIFVYNYLHALVFLVLCMSFFRASGYMHLAFR